MENNNSLYTLLQKIAVEEKIENPDIQVTAITSGGANFSSNLYLADIIDLTNKKTLKLFAKIAAPSKAVRESMTFQGYDVEVMAYSNLFKVYRQLEEKHGVPEEHTLMLTKYYGSDSTYLQETIVLEDLSSKGFELYSRFESVDWPYADSAITELAKLHALSLSYQHEKPDEFNKLLKSLQHIGFPDNDETKSSLEHVSRLAIDTVHEKNKNKLEKFLNSANINTCIADNVKAIRCTVLIHGDFRPSNMLYRIKPNGGTEVIPVDYQGVQGGCPVFDLIYFIVCGTDGPFRAKYYPRLIDHYYSELGASLSRLRLNVEDIYTRDDYEFELKELQETWRHLDDIVRRAWASGNWASATLVCLTTAFVPILATCHYFHVKKLPCGLLLSVIGLPLLMTPEDQAPNPEDFSLSAGLAVQTGNLYKTRLNDLVDDYVAWGILVD